MANESTFPTGADTYVDSGDPSPHTDIPVAPLVEDQTLYLLDTGLGDLDGTVTISSAVLSVVMSSDFAGNTITLRVRPLVSSWDPALVFADLPGFGSGPVTFTGSVAAGQVVTFDVATMVAAGAVDGWFGVALDRTDGGSGTGGVFTMSDSTGSTPSLVVDWFTPLDAPTNLQPSNGGLIGSQFPIVTGDAGDAEILAVQVQWKTADTGFDPSSGFASPGFDSGTVAATSCQLDLSSTAFAGWPGLADSWWTMRFETPDGWSQYGDPVSARYRARPAPSITYPPAPPNSLVFDISPEYQGDFTGTMTAYRWITSDGDGVILDDSGRRNGDDATYQTGSDQTSPTGVGYVIPDERDQALTFRAWDDATGRQATPGCPIYGETTQVFSRSSDFVVHPPTDLAVQQINLSPWVRLLVTVDSANPTDFFVIEIGGQAMSRIPRGDLADPDSGEAGDVYTIPVFRAPPWTLNDFTVRRVVGKNLSEPSPVASSFVEPTGTWATDASLRTPTVAQCGGIGSTISKADAITATYAIGAEFPQTQISSEHGLTGQIQGDILDYGGIDAATWQSRWRVLTGRGQTVWIGYANVSLPVVLSSLHCDPRDGDPSPSNKALTVDWVQVGPGLLFDEPPDDGQVSTALIDFESYADGDPITSDDPSGAIPADPTGSVTANADAAENGSLMGCVIASQSGGSTLPVTINPRAWSVEIDSQGITALPTGSDKAIWTAKDADSDIVMTVHIGTSGKLQLRDSTAANRAESVAKLAVDTPFRLVILGSWVAGTQHSEVFAWLGGNKWGGSPDIHLLWDDDAAAAAPYADGALIGCPTTAGFDLPCDNIRIINTTAIGAPLATPQYEFAYLLAGWDTVASSLLVAGQVEAGMTLKLAHSASAGSDGFPTSPTLTGTITADDNGFFRGALTGITPGTVRYFAVADTDGNTFGNPAYAKPLPAANTAGTVNIANISCQASNSQSEQGWVSVDAWDPDLVILQGDWPSYGGGTYTPETLPATMCLKTSNCMTKLPAMRTFLQTVATIHQDSDHDLYANNGYKDEDGTPDYPAGLIISATGIQANQIMRPVTYADGTGRARYQYWDVFRNRSGGQPSVRAFLLDMRSLDRTDGMQPDGPDKTALGAPQLAWLDANLLPAGHGLNLLIHEGAWYATAVSGVPSWEKSDKWWVYRWEQVNTLVPMLTGLSVDYLGADVHKLGYLDRTQNPLCSWMDVCIASAIEQHGLHLDTGEIYKDSSGTDQYFGDDPAVTNYQYGRFSLSDDNAGTITRVFTGWDAVSGSAKIGPFTRTWSYT